MSRFKLVFFSPVTSTNIILSGLLKKFPDNVGKIGQYYECAFVSTGKGQFRPGPKANPTIGDRGELEYVDENKIEVVVSDSGTNNEIKAAVEELKRVWLICNV